MIHCVCLVQETEQEQDVQIYRCFMLTNFQHWEKRLKQPIYFNTVKNLIAFYVNIFYGPLQRETSEPSPAWCRANRPRSASGMQEMALHCFHWLRMCSKVTSRDGSLARHVAT